MNDTLSKLKTFFQKLAAHIPTYLPIGMTEFNAWAESIFKLYSWPDNDSMRFALAAMIINQGSTTVKRSKHYFYTALRASAAKEVAGGVFRDLKIKQFEAEKAAKKTAEATALSVVPSDVSAIQN